MLTCAMPAPIRPAPTTPIVSMRGISGLVSGVAKRFFLSAVCPWKIEMSARDSGVMPSAPKRVASASKPASTPRS
jgi:hypothetical protein